MKQKIKHFLEKTRYSYRSLPDKKQYVEFFTAVLSVPVLLTVIVLNVNNLRGTNVKPAEAKPEPTTVKEIVYISPERESNEVSEPEPSPTASEICKKEIGPIAIRTPEEGSTVTDNPLMVTIDYDQGDYCAVVWAYRINNGKWSEYDDKSIALYNLPNGQVTITLKVKSIVTGEEKQISRSFTYQSDETPVASNSAN